MHKVIYLTLPKEKLLGDYSEKHINELVDEYLSPFTLEEDGDNSHKDIFLDYYSIGGRFSGPFMTQIDSNSSIFTNENAYGILDKYNAYMNDGKPGPYIIDGVEYKFVNGACKKDIKWEILEKIVMAINSNWALWKYVIKTNYELPSEGNKERVDDSIYENGILLFDNNDELSDFLKRLVDNFSLDETLLEFNSKFSDIYNPGNDFIDAFVSKDGKWHDVVDLDLPPELLKAVSEAEAACFGESDVSNIYDYINALDDDDYIVVVDGHI